MKDKKNWLMIGVISALVALVVTVIMNGSGLTGFAANVDELAGDISEGTGSVGFEGNSDILFSMTGILGDILGEVEDQGAQIAVIQNQVDALASGTLSGSVGDDTTFGDSEPTPTNWCDVKPKTISATASTVASPDTEGVPGFWDGLCNEAESGTSILNLGLSAQCKDYCDDYTKSDRAGGSLECTPWLSDEKRSTGSVDASTQGPPPISARKFTCTVTAVCLCDP
ncbi:MAG: hypothetical protein KAT77_04260 [Nanoarchaeota archaeon]|nr:hypothetical protein [Nanoarchaeota archaeon]